MPKVVGVEQVLGIDFLAFSFNKLSYKFLG